MARFLSLASRQRLTAPPPAAERRRRALVLPTFCRRAMFGKGIEDGVFAVGALVGRAPTWRSFDGLALKPTQSRLW